MLEASLQPLLHYGQFLLVCVLSTTHVIELVANLPDAVKIAGKTILNMHFVF